MEISDELAQKAGTLQIPYVFAVGAGFRLVLLLGGFVGPGACVSCFFVPLVGLALFSWSVEVI